MEQINLHNYEAFFLDFIEGNLNAAGEASLRSFLADNPDVLQEFNDLLADQGMAELKLEASTAPVFDKQALLVDENIISLLTVDHWMCSKVEGLLNEQEVKALAEFVKEYHLGTKMAAYEAAVLVAGTEGYGNKRDLKRKDGIVIPLYVKFAAAAAVGAVLMGLFYTQNPDTNNQAANNAVESVKTVNGMRSTYAYSSKVFDNQGTNANQNSFENVNKSNDLAENESLFPESPDTASTVIPIDVIEDGGIAGHLPLDKDTTHTNPVDNKTDVFNEDEVTQVEQIKGGVVEEEPFRLITNAAGNLMNRDIHYTRNLNTETDQYVAHHFKLGKFEFERKKSK